MSLSFEEIQAQQRPQREQARADHVRQLRERQEVGQKMSELMADPRWEIWGRHLESMRDQAKDRLALIEIKLTSEVLSPDEYLRVKVSQAQARGMWQSYNNALLLAKTLIEQGEKAVEELKNGQDI